MILLPNVYSDTWTAADTAADAADTAADAAYCLPSETNSTSSAYAILTQLWNFP